MSRQVTHLIILFLALGFISCKKRVPNPFPHLTDSIYNNLSTSKKNAQSEANSLQHEIEKLKKDLEKISAKGSRNGKEDFMMEELHTLENKFGKAVELYRYYSLKTDERYNEVQKLYPIYFEQDKPWPDVEEYARFLASKDSIFGSKEWNGDKRVKKYNKARERKPAAAPSGHH